MATRKNTQTATQTTNQTATQTTAQGATQPSPSTTHIKKYELLNKTIVVDGRELHQIKSLVQIGIVPAGEEGGFVESEANLSQDGECWLWGTSKVFGNAKVSENCVIAGNSEISGNSVICGNAIINNSIVKNNAAIGGSTEVKSSVISGDVEIFGDAKIKECSISDSVTIGDNAHLEYCEVHDLVHLGGDVHLIGCKCSGCISVTFGKEVKNTSFDADFARYASLYYNGISDDTGTRGAVRNAVLHARQHQEEPVEAVSGQVVDSSDIDEESTIDIEPEEAVAG